jgi:hypothetical protein
VSAQSPYAGATNGVALPTPPPTGVAAVPVTTASPLGVVDRGSVVDDLGAPAGIFNPGGIARGWYGGAEFLLLRTHFSEAVAYVRVTDSLTPQGLVRQTEAREINFAYDPSFRVFLGYYLDPTTSLRLSYWYFNTSIVDRDTVTQPNERIVDPFGNTAAPGQSAFATAGVRLHVYDLDLTKNVVWDSLNLTTSWAAGARLADIPQSYGVNINDPVAGPVSHGDFRTDFFGAGPHVQLAAFTGTPQSAWSLYAKTDMAVILGQYDVSAGVAVPGAQIGQHAGRTRVVPVLGGELGGAFRPLPNLTLCVGWQMQAWFNMGVSGGQFGGAFVGTDDSDIMGFDGLVLRAQYRY